MRMVRLFCFLALCGALAASSALAQADVCRSLLEYGTFDSNDTYSDKQAFLLAQHVVCEATFESYENAKSSASSGGVDVFDILGASGSDAVTTQNYVEKRRRFCDLDFSAFAGSDTALLHVRSASAVLASSFVDCVTRVSGFFGYVNQSRNKEAFVITVGNNVVGDNSFKITQISAQPAVIKCSNGEEKATYDHPLPAIGARLINCVNTTPEKSFLLAVSTDKGIIRGPNGTGVELAGTAETLADLQERVQALEARSTPAGTIAYFQGACPNYWEDFAPLVGRYAVGVTDETAVGNAVGTPLGIGENRPTGNHTHSYSDDGVYHWRAGLPPETKYEGLATEFRGSSGVGLYHVARETQGVTNGIDGTNAPYLLLRPCRKI